MSAPSPRRPWQTAERPRGASLRGVAAGGAAALISLAARAAAPAATALRAAFAGLEPAALAPVASANLVIRRLGTDRSAERAILFARPAATAAAATAAIPAPAVGAAGLLLEPL